MSMDSTSFKAAVFSDLERELTVTRSVLAAVPDGQHDWKPHEKSMSLGRLALHVAYLPDWARATLAADELDAAAAPQIPKSVRGVHELLEHFDRKVAELRAEVAKFDIANWERPWSMRSGGQIMVTKPRSYVYRVWCLNHLVHHRGQVCVYLRMLNVPVPTVYFNTADDPRFVFE
ncbi:MAG TPA: DinB family protein [Tepidisphaeraceae bacterium]